MVYVKQEMVRRKTENPKKELWTRELVNVAALKDLASRSAAGVVCWPGSDVEIRRILCDYLVATSRCAGMRAQGCVILRRGCSLEE